MKKALVILLAIFMVGAAFAEDVVAPTFSGSVSATWGYNFQEKASGFKNESDAKATFPLAAFGTKTQEGSGMYGEITIKDFGLKVDTKDGLDYQGDDFAISGKIYFGNGLYMGVYNKPSLDYNFAENLRKADPGVQYIDVNTNNNWIASTGGVEFGYKSDLVDVALKTASKGDWDQAGAKTKIDAKKNTPWSAFEGQDAADADTTFNTANLYVLQGALTLKPVKDVLTIDVAYTFLPEKYMGTNAKVFNTLNAKIATKAGNFDASVGMDAAFYDKNDSAYGASLENTFALDFAPALSYSVVEGFKVGAKAWGYAAPMKDSKADMPMDLQVYVEEEMDKGLVAPLSAKLTFTVNDLLGDKNYLGVKADNDDFEYKVALEAAYKIVDGLKVSANTSYNYAKTFTVGGSLELGAAFHKIANTTFTLKYADFAEAEKDADDNKGTFTAAAKISF